MAVDRNRLEGPKRLENGRYQINKNGDKEYPRIVLIGDKEAGDALVPEGSGRVVVARNLVFGIPSKTSNEEEAMEYGNHTTHFYFDPNPDIDERTGRQDVAVARGGAWRRVVHGRCLGVDAGYGRWSAGSGGSFRQVRGSLPEIEKSLAKINPRDVEEEPKIEVVS